MPRSFRLLPFVVASRGRGFGRYGDGRTALALALTLSLALSAGCAKTRAERAFREADPNGFAAFNAAAHALQEKAPAEFEAYWRHSVVALAQGVDYYGVGAFEADLEAAAPEEYEAFVEVVNALPYEYETVNWIASHQGVLNSLRPRGPTAGTTRDPELVSYPRFAEPRRRRALEPGDSSRVPDEHAAEQTYHSGPRTEAVVEARVLRDAKIAEVEAARDARIAEVEAARDARIAEVEAARDARIAEVEAARDARLAELDAAEQTQRREVARKRGDEVLEAETSWKAEKEREVLNARAAMDAALAAVIEAFWEDADLAKLAQEGLLWIRETIPGTTRHRENIVGRTLYMFHAFAEETVGETMEWGTAGEDWRPGMVSWPPLTEEQTPYTGRGPWSVGAQGVLGAHREAWAEYFAAEARWELAREAANARAANALRAATENATAARDAATENATAARDEAHATANRQVSAACAEYEVAREAADAELKAAIQRSQ